MPCHIPATSSSSRRRPPTLLAKPPEIMATLDLSKPVERQAFDLVHRMGSGRWPVWRILDMRRKGQALYLAVEWARARKRGRHSLAEVSLDEQAVRWTDLPSAAAARDAVKSVRGL